MNYIKFKPSRVEIYDKQKDDKYYIFRSNKVLINKKDYSLPNRSYVEKNLELKDCLCMGGYQGYNYYQANIDCDDINKDYKFVDLRKFMENTDKDIEYRIASRASLINSFKDRNENCGYCGGETILIDHREDWAVRCSDCGMYNWPTTSPAIIVAVTKEDKLLMGSNVRWADDRYSVIAGFVEMGENFEDAVKREVLEETGIKVKNIKYFGSQAWPFPNSMMIGFTAEYLSGDIVIEKEELTDVKWFKKEEIPGKFNNSKSIGSKLIRWFLNEYKYKK